MPFIADDVLVNFDNQRAFATLRVPAESAGETQVLSFTHHLHVVGSAKSAASRRVTVIRLEGRV